MKRKVTGVLSILLSLWVHTSAVFAFVIHTKTSHDFDRKRTHCGASAPVTESESPTIVDHSTLTLLEHVNFNIPSHEHAVPFYYDILGCGFDPRMADNLEDPAAGSTIWANCGASQFHLCYNSTEPTLQGRIGLRYDSLEELQNRLAEHEKATDKDSRCFQSYTIETDSRGKKQITVVDRYDNVFVCQTPLEPHPEAPVSSLKQPIVTHVDHFVPSFNPSDSDEAFWEDLACRFGREAPECRGISFVEMNCPKGTADDIAKFYESVFDAITSVIMVQEQQIAMIAIGGVDEHGRADQYLLFKEQPSTTPIRNTGHHIAMYVGENAADFEQAYKNAEMAGVVWVNPRFADEVDSLSAAKREKQFRMKNILALQSGETIMEFEHEIRSIEHQSFPRHGD